MKMIYFLFSTLFYIRGRCKHRHSGNVAYGEFQLPKRYSCILRDARGTAYHITVLPRANSIHIRNNFLDQSLHRITITNLFGKLVKY